VTNKGAAPPAPAPRISAAGASSPWPPLGQPAAPSEPSHSPGRRLAAGMPLRRTRRHEERRSPPWATTDPSEHSQAPMAHSGAVRPQPPADPCRRAHVCHRSPHGPTMAHIAGSYPATMKPPGAMWAHVANCLHMATYLAGHLRNDEPIAAHMRHRPAAPSKPETGHTGLHVTTWLSTACEGTSGLASHGPG